MSPAVPVQTSVKAGIPTVSDVSTAGGVWAPTSAKRDKIAELKTELKEGQTTLDDAATPEQKLDLYFADGIKLVAKMADQTTADLEGFKQRFSVNSGSVTETEFQAQASAIIEQIDKELSNLPSDCLRYLRDFYDPVDLPSDDTVSVGVEELAADDDRHFQDAVLRLRLHLAKAALRHIQESWKTLTTVSDSDVDRAAVKQQELERQLKSLNGDKVTSCVHAFLTGTCKDRMAALWSLVDHDEDGLLEQDEMNQVAHLAIKPVETAMVAFLDEALDAYPVRAEDLSPPSEAGDANHGSEQPERPQQTKKGFFAKRREKKIRKLLSRMFVKTTKTHFVDEVETDHRLRCIYAWAEKKHQDNKVDSVLIDSGWSSRKRYVELSAKISLDEFQEVQKEHFTHLERVGEELMRSYCEDLLVYQGKQRQNQELLRDCMLFLAVVSVIDYSIIIS